MTVFAFDRDRTVDVNPPRGRRGVPLEWVRYLAHETDHEVWAIGNQRLKDEADIPGIAEAVERHPDLTDSPESAVHYARERRVRIVGELFPDANARIVVDDVNLEQLDGWTHYFPWGFVAAVEDGDLDAPLPPDGASSGRDRTDASSVDVLARLKGWLFGDGSDRR